MKKDDFEINFWKKWIYADHLERLKLVDNLPFYKRCLEMKELKLGKDSFTLMLNSFFEDLESAFYTKIRLENKKI